MSLGWLCGETTWTRWPSTYTSIRSTPNQLAVCTERSRATVPPEVAGAISPKVLPATVPRRKGP